MNKVFISYRHADSLPVARRVYNWLTRELGEGRVFKDDESIVPGADFRRNLQEALDQCDVLLVMIGRRWMESFDESEQRLRGVEADYVRFEIESGLGRNIHVIPVLIDGARMPRETELPPGLGQFAYCHAMELHSGQDFKRDMRRLHARLSGDGEESFFFKPAPTWSGEDSPYARLFASIFPRLHFRMVRKGWMRQPPELPIIRDYLDYFEGKMETLNQIVRYVPLGGAEAPGNPPPESEYVTPQTRTEMLKSIRRTVRLLSGVSKGGNQATARLASINRFSRVVHNVARLLRHEKRPIILLGDPGSGKSVTLREVGLQITREGLKRAWPDVAIYVPLGSYHAAKGDTPGEVWTLVRQRIPPEHSKLLDLLPSLGREGRLVILFDGMDEMDRRLYGARVARLSEFASKHYRTVKTLFACRTNDFSPQFIHRQLVILGFHRRQVKEYLLHNFGPWPRLIGGEAFDAERIARHLLSDGELSETARNPFNLYLLGVFIQSRQALPKTRHELYDNFLQALYDRPRDGAGRPLSAADRPAYFDAWARLAYRITGRHAGTSLALGDLGDEWSGVQSRAAIDHGLRGGLLVLDEHDEHAIRFTHHRLQEYLTAQFLDKYGTQHADVDWHSLIDTPRWQEILIDLASIQQERSEALRVVLESMQSVTAPAAEKSVGEDEGVAARRREWSGDEERVLADRVVLASQVIGELGQNASKLPPRFLETFTASVTRLAEKGRPTTQVKMLWAWGNTANFCQMSALDTPLQSEVEWVREQALSVIGGASLTRTRVDADLRRELVIDLTGGRLLRRLRAYRQAITRANDPWLYVDLVWAVTCRAVYTTGIFGLLFAVYLVALTLWPTPFDLERQLPGLSRGILALMLSGISLSAAALVRYAWGRGFWHRAALACVASISILYTLNQSWRGEHFLLSAVGGVLRAGIALGAAALGMQLVFWLSFGMYMLLHLWRDDPERAQTALRIARKNSSFDADRVFFKISGIALSVLVGLRLLAAGYAMLDDYVLQPTADYADSLFQASPWPARFLGTLAGLLLMYWLRAVPQKLLSGLRQRWEHLRSTGDGSWRALGGGILNGVGRGLLALLSALPRLLLSLLKLALGFLGLIFGVLLLFSPLMVAMLALDWAGIDSQKRSHVLPLLLMLALLSLLALGLLRFLRPAWVAFRNHIQGRLGRSALFGMKIEEWVRRMKAADPEGQSWLLGEASPDALGIEAGEFLLALEGLEDDIAQEPAASRYWKMRHTLEEITRQDRLAHIADLAEASPAPRNEKTSPVEERDGDNQSAEVSDIDGSSEIVLRPRPASRRFRRARWVMSALLLLAATGALLNLYMMRHRTIYIVNGLPAQLEVRIDGGEAFRMEPQTFQSRVFAEGTHTVVTRRAQHEPRTEDFTIASSWFYRRFLDDDIYIVNLEGAAVLRYTPGFIWYKDRWRAVDSFYDVGLNFVRLPRPVHLFEEARGADTDKPLVESELRLSPDLPGWAFRSLPLAYSDEEKLDLAEKHLGSDPENTLLLAEYESFAVRHGDTRRCRDFLQSRMERQLLPVEWYESWQRVSLRLGGVEILPGLEQKLAQLLGGAAQGQSMLLYLSARRQVSLAEGLGYYEKIIQTNPAFAHAWLGKCVALERQGELKQAREACLESQRLYRESVEKDDTKKTYGAISLALRARVPWDALLHEAALKTIDLDLDLGDYPTATTHLQTLRKDWGLSHAAHLFALALDTLNGEHDRARQRHEEYSADIPSGTATSAAYLHYLLQEFDDFSRAAEEIGEEEDGDELRAYARLELGDYGWAERNYHSPYPEDRGFMILLSGLGSKLGGEQPPDLLRQKAEEELRASNLPVYQAVADLLASPSAASLDQVADINLPPDQKAVVLVTLARRFPALREAALNSASKYAYTPFPPGHFLRHVIKATENEITTP
jgi:hypothetical protein